MSEPREALKAMDLWMVEGDTPFSCNGYTNSPIFFI